MTATAMVTWPELIEQSYQTGQLPVVIPTGSQCVAGLFAPNPQYEIPFALACFSDDDAIRVRVICAAVICSHYEVLGEM